MTSQPPLRMITADDPDHQWVDAADYDRLREAARQLITGYMAGQHLGPLVAVLEDAAGFKQQEGS